MDVFSLKAILTLDSSAFDSGLNSAKSAASSLASGIGTAMKVGVAAVGAATAAVGAFAKSAVDTGMSFDKSMSQVYATMGDKAEKVIEYNGQMMSSADALRDYAMEMGRQTVFSASEAADALNYMALAGYDAEESMAMLPNVLNLAAAGSMDLAKASDMLTDTQTALGLSFERTNLLVDEMAKAASTGNTNVEQLGDAMLTIGGLAKNLNGGFVESANGAMIFADGTQELEIALTAMANAGVKGSEAGTHMRNMLLKLAKPTSDGAVALKQMGVDVFDLDGRMRSLKDIFTDLNEAMGNMTQEEKLSTIGDLFNTRDIAASEALLGAVGTKWDDIGMSILDAKIPLNDVIEDIEKAGFNFEQLGFTGDREIEKLAGDIRQELGTAGKTVGEAAADIADAYDISLGEALKAVNAVQAGLEEATGSAQEMADTQVDNLAGDIKMFQSALEGAQIIISDTLSPTLREFVTFGKNSITELADAFEQGGLSGAMGKLGGVIAEGLGMITQKAPEAVSAGVQLLSALGEGLMQNTDAIINAGVQIMGILADAFVTGLPDFISAGMEILEKFMSAIAENKDKVSSMVTELITGLVSAMTENLPDMLETGLIILTAIATGILDAIPEAASTLAECAVELLQTLAEGMAENVPTLVEGIKTVISSLAEMFQNPEALSSMIGAALDIILALVDGITQAMPAMAQAAPVVITGLIDGLVTALPQIIEAALVLIEALIEALADNAPLLMTASLQITVALVNGLIKALPLLVAAIPQLVAAVVSGIMKGLPSIIASGVQMVMAIISGITSILGNLMGMGINIVAEFVKGVTSALGRVVNAAKEMGEKFKSKIQEFIEGAAQWGKDLIGNFIGGIKDGWDNLKGAIGGAAQVIADNIGFSEPKEGPLSNFHTYAPDMMKLFAEGIADNSGLIKDAFAENLSFTSAVNPQIQGSKMDNAQIVALLQRIADQLPIRLEGDADRIFRVVQNKANANVRLTGKAGLGMA